MLNKIQEKIKNKLDEIKYVSSTHVAASMCNSETFKPILDCNIGREVVLCGAGPTLKQYKPINGALHVALNRALLNEKIKFEWFIADDWDGVDFIKETLLSYDCKKFFGHQLGADYRDHRQIPETYRRACNAARYYTDSYMKTDIWKSKFVCDIDKMAIANMPNIALSAMQIVLFSNPKRIYLVGCDASSGHFIQPKNLNQERIDKQEKDIKMAVSSNRVIDKWKELKEFANAFYPDIEIISINPVGLKGIFIDQYQE